MIDPQTYTLEWIKSASKRNSNADKILIEKVIRALTLLTDLKTTGLDFIFKGGTALMLLLKQPKRLSIDIDIIISKKNIDLDKVFNKIIENKNFIRFEKQARFTNNGIEKAHYKFFYTPTFKTHSKEEYILLDILFEKNPYEQLTETPIISPFLLIKEPAETVKTPSIENILGDKLTAFAPNTTGIPYYKKAQSMSMEIMKQLYDIGNLFDATNNIQLVKNTFERIAHNELIYRGQSNLTIDDVLNDIIQTALCISTRGKAGKGNFIELQKGIERVKNFIISGKFQIDNAIIAASKAAYIAAMIKLNKFHFEKFDKAQEIKELIIEDAKYNKLNKLKKTNREAFWYWWFINSHFIDLV